MPYTIFLSPIDWGTTANSYEYMEQHLKNNEEIVRYLLGDISEKGKEQFIDKCLGNEELFNRMLAVEEELIDDYVRGELPPLEHRRFEEQYLVTPEQRERVKHAKAFSMALAQEKRASRWQWVRRLLPSRYPALGYSLIAVALLMLLGGVWFIKETVQLRNQLKRSQIDLALLQQRQQELIAQVNAAHGYKEQSEENRKRIQEQLNQIMIEKAELQRRVQEFQAGRSQIHMPGIIPSVQSPPDNLASLTLKVGHSSERESSKTLVISPGVKVVRLQLNLEKDDFTSYRAILEDTSGKNESLTQSGLRAELTKSGKKVVSVSFSAGQVASGIYVLTLYGVTDDGKDTRIEQWRLIINSR